MKNLKLYSVLLGLFDGEGGGTGAASGGAVAGGTNAPSGAENQAVSTQRSNSGAKSQTTENSAQNAPVAGENSTKSQEDRQRAYRELMDGEYKDIYQDDIQGLINRRFKETKALRETNAKQQAVLDILAQRYGITDGDAAKIQEALDKDNGIWADMAAEAGFDDVSKYREFVKLQIETKNLRAAEAERRASEERAQRAQQERRYVQEKIDKWSAEGESLKATYPDFDLAREQSNKEFASALAFYEKAQVPNPVERAYTSTHHNELVEQARAQTEKNVVDNIRAKGLRPMENGTQNNSSFTAGVDWSKLTKAQRADLLRRAENGEIITPHR